MKSPTSSIPPRRVAPRASLPFLAVIALIALAAPHLSALPAFPGAEGFGADASGGRGGSVYIVTNLNDSGPGSFRDAVSQPNRTVVFAVGGIITATSPIVVRSNITIAGQTAPGGGVTIYGDRISYSGANNTITRYIRYRQGINGDSGTDAVSIASGDKMIFDHVSASWGRDETFSASGSPSNLTLQDCIIGQGLLVHSAGSLMETSGGVSIFRCLYIDNWMRNPKVKGVNDYQNNIVYNWGGGGGYIPAGDSAGLSFANLINNTFIAGPNTGNEGPFKSGNQNYSLFHAGNFQDLNVNGILDGVPVTNASFPTLKLVPTAFAYPAPATLLTAAQAYAHVLAFAGASLHRDHADTVMLAELASLGTSGAHIFNESEIGGIGTLPAGLAPKDTDGDGMPDWWEAAAGTNPLVADHNGDINGDGYTNLENYLNAVAVAGVPAATINSISSDTGASSSDGITSDNTLVLHGTAAPGASVTLSRVDTGVIGSAVANGAGQWSFDYSAVALPDRYYAFMASVGASPPSRALVVKVDTTPAAAPEITSVVLAPSFAITGTAEPGSDVEVTLVGTGIVGTATTDELGNWSALYTGAPLAPGAHTFTAAATDLAGNAGASSAPYAVDTSLAAPIFTAIVSDTGASAIDQITNDPTLILNGTSFANATVSVTRVGVGVIGAAIADGSGTWSFNYQATTLPAGTHAFTATASGGGIASPSSTAFVVTIDTTRPTISSIRRQNPSTAATTASTLVFRVTFAEPVSGVDVGDCSLTLSGVTATLSSLTPISSTIYDVTVTGASGDGTVRLDLKSSGTGIVDVAGNTISGGFTAGQTFTIRLPGSGVWVSTESGEPWSVAANWENGTIANGAGATADFATRDLNGEVVVQLDSARTLGRVVFGDTDFSTPTLWKLSDNGSPANVLTLAGPSPNLQVNAATTASGDTVDVPAANAYPSTLDVVLAGAAGFTKTGIGTLEFTKPATISGPLTVTKGIVQVGPGGSFSPSSVFLATSQQLRIAGGTFNTTGDVTWNSGTGTGIIVSAGTATFNRILPSNFRNSFVRVTGGTMLANEIAFPRSGDSESQSISAGIQISGGESIVGKVGLGTDNSWGAMTISGGTMTVTGQLHVGHQVTTGRGGVVIVSGGEFNSTDASPGGGMILSRNPGSQPNNVSRFTITGGVSNVARLTLGYDATSTAGSATVSLSNGELNLGSGGIVKNGTGGMTTTITLNSGTLGAFAPWSTTHPIVLAGTPATLALRAANSAGVPVDYTLAGVLSGAGGFTKTGAGMLTLTGANTFTGSVTINAGTLLVTNSLASGGDVTINPGGTLAGNGTINKTIVLNGGTFAPDGSAAASTVTWNSGSLLAIRIGANGVSDQLALTGALTKGTAGTFPIALDAGPGFAAGNTYTIATFGSTTFSAGDFVATGLPPGYAAFFSLNGTSLQVTVKAIAQVILGHLRQFYDGTLKLPSATTNPVGLNVMFTFNASLTAPTLPGTYAIVAMINDPIYTGSANGTLVITTTALVRHAPTIAGGIDGSAHVLLPENVMLTGDLSHDLLVPGTPTVRINGKPTFAEVQNATGGAGPTDYTITLSGGAVVRYIVRRVDPVAMPAVSAPRAPTGTRNVVLNNSGQSPGDFATLRNLTLNGGAGTVAVPPGAYGNFIANGGSAFVLGVAGATEPAVYHLQQLTLNGAANLQVVGPVIVRLANNFAFGSTAGSAGNPRWLTLQLATGGVTLNTGATLHGEVVAPNGTVILHDGATLNGNVSADRLTINANGLLHETAP